MTPPRESKVRKSSICLAIRQLRSFSRALRSLRLFGSVVVLVAFCVDALRLLLVDLAFLGVAPDELGFDVATPDELDNP